MSTFKWNYCPTCGSELVEVYPGDFSEHITCDNSNCSNDGINGFSCDEELISSLYEEIADLHEQLMEERTWKKLTRRTGRT